MKRRDQPNCPTLLKLVIEKNRDKFRLEKKSRDKVNACQFKSSVYIVFAGGGIQYVGCTTKGFGSRFLKGIREGLRSGRKSYDGTAFKGYRWPNAFEKVTVVVWEIPDEDKIFAEAIEADLAMLTRVGTGFWPVELRGISPNNFLSSDQTLMYSARWAHSMFEWLLSNKLIELVDVCLDQINDLREFDKHRLLS